MPKFHKYNLLLDEGLPPCKGFPKTNEKHNLKHIRDDYKFVALSDPNVYQQAVKTKRLLIIFNLKDYHKLAKTSKMTGIIGISQEMSRKQMDSKLLALLSHSKPGDLYGKYTVITGQTTF